MHDLVVIGGGPVGVMMGLLAARRGLTACVIEKATEVYDLPRAIVMDDEIQRVFHQVGLGPGLSGIVTPLQGAEFVTADGEQIMGLELDPAVRYPLGHHPTVTYYQPQLEAFIREAAVEAGVDLRLGTEMTACSQHATDVSVTVRGPTGPETLEAAWVVAADGASSPTRKLLGIPFEDQGFDQDWLVLDVQLTRPVETLPRFVQQVCDPARPTTFVVGHASYRRWEFQLQPGETREDMVQDHRIWELLEGWLTPDDATVVRAVVYRFHATVAGAMRAGRIFLAGDAAHQMPPFLGQGLCSGIRDAAGLAWRLQLMKLGLGGEALLDTYAAERVPHAAGVVAHAVDTGKLIDHLAGRETDTVGLDSAYGGGRPMPRLEHGLIHGDSHPVGRQVHQPEIDGQGLDRLLGNGFCVLTTDVLSVPVHVVDAWADIGGRVVEIPADALPGTLVAGGAVIVRPDRYVAAVANTPEELSTASAALLAIIRP